MSRPIKMTPELIAKASQEFIEEIQNSKMFDGKIEFSRIYKYDTEQRAKLGFSPAAFSKMMMLVQKFDSEVAWHGTARRSKKADNVFHIDDIFVYPQEVTGSTVNTDQLKYQQWLMSFDDETFNNIRMQGHSHVNMGTTPSGVDVTHQQSILGQLEENMFYIFMIWNKKYESTIKIFDLKNNTLYETADIDIFIGGVNVNFDAFIKDAQSMVTKKAYINNGHNYSGASSYPPKTTPKTDKKDDKPKNRADIGSEWGKFNSNSQFYGR